MVEQKSFIRPLRPPLIIDSNDMTDSELVPQKQSALEDLPGKSATDSDFRI
jgi:hypothetical protein